MYVADTNVASEFMRAEPMPAVAMWISEHDAQELYLTTASEAELLYVVATPSAGRRRNALGPMTRWLDQGFADRILPFDSAANDPDGA